MISPTDIRLIKLMIEKCGRLIDICNTYDDKTIESNYVYSDAIQYEFEKLYEDTTRLSTEIRIIHPEIHLNDLRSIRNRVAHDYESVSLQILLDTIHQNIPKLKEDLENLLNS